MNWRGLWKIGTDTQIVSLPNWIYSSNFEKTKFCLISNTSLKNQKNVWGVLISQNKSRKTDNMYDSNTTIDENFDQQ